IQEILGVSRATYYRRKKFLHAGIIKSKKPKNLRKSKFIYANCYSNAKSSTATKFLRELITKAPYTIKSIQVDGGSEFMKDFEDTCKELEIPLYVLPPASPKYNGGVERSKGIFRTEFYDNPNLLEDSIGPHQGLKGDTPMGDINGVQEISFLSHDMCKVV
ncbi:MAG: hypothetical protein LBI95_01540, partial [Holosporales bacterium]|nr:hypothetical protein [Holosporales bacterium]